MQYIPKVIQAIPGDGNSVYAYFSDGTVRKYDVSHLVEMGGVFAQLRDKDFFRGRLTVMNGAVAWDVTGDRDATQCIDLDPMTTYEKGVVVPDPLEEAS